jgi:hypothetical protein
MTPAAFRKLALAMPGAEESAHMDHPDFRVAGKVFATLTGDESAAFLKLTPAQQAGLIADLGDAATPAAGAWGKRGYTRVELKAVTAARLRPAVVVAWRNTAPRAAREAHDER